MAIEETYQLLVGLILIVASIYWLQPSASTKPKLIETAFDSKGKRTDAMYKPTSFSIDAIPSLEGKTALVTGGNSGIGYHTVKHLALKGAKVFMAARSQEKAENAIAKMKQEADGLGKTLNIEFVHLDLADLKLAKEAGRNFVARGIAIDILVCNAGGYFGCVDDVNDSRFQVTKDGYETHFATNHLGHFQFVKEILPVLLKAQEKPRVVVVSSSATWNAPTCGIDFKSVVQKQPGFRTTNYYGQSKLANSLFAVGLNTRYGDQLIVNAVHPGVVDTDLFQITPYSPTWFITRFIPFRFILVAFLGGEILNAERGAHCSLYAATSKEIEEKGVKGKYLIPFGAVSDDHHPLALDTELAKKLWIFSEQMCADVCFEL